MSGLFDQIATSSTHSLALDESGAVYAWGDNRSGACGVSSLSFVYTPAVCFQDCTHIAAGSHFSVFVHKQSGVFACGRSREGQCGAYDGEILLSPRQVAGFPSSLEVDQVCCGDGFSLLLAKDRSVFTWGCGSFGELGIRDPLGSNSPQGAANHLLISHLPTQIYLNSCLHPGETVETIACGAHNCLLATSLGRCIAWGRNAGNCFGLAEPLESVSRPIVLTNSALSHIRSVAAADDVLVFLRDLTTPTRKVLPSNPETNQTTPAETASPSKWMDFPRVKDTKTIRQLDLEEQNRLLLWRSQLYREYFTHGLTNQVAAEWRRGLPIELRGKLWSHQIGNALHLTREIYAMYQRHWKRHRLSIAYAFREPGGNSTVSIGREQSLRGVGVDLSRTFGYPRESRSTVARCSCSAWVRRCEASCSSAWKSSRFIGPTSDTCRE